MYPSVASPPVEIRAFEYNVLSDDVLTGGGVIGAATAYYLTHHRSFDPQRHQVVILEATRVASGASGKAGGLLASWAYPLSIAKLSFSLHRDLAREHDGAKAWGYRPVRYGHVSVTTPEDEVTITTAPETNAFWPSRATIWLGKLKTKAMDHWPMTTTKSVGMPAELDWFVNERVNAYQDIDPAGSEATAQLLPYQFTTTLMQLAIRKGARVILGTAQKILYTRAHSGKESESRTTASSSGSSMGSDHGSSSSYTSPEEATPLAVESISYFDHGECQASTIAATDVVLAAGPWTTTLLPEAPISAMRAHSITVKAKRELSPFCLYTEIHRAKDKQAGGMDCDSSDAIEGSSASLNRVLKHANRGEGEFSHETAQQRIMSPEIYARPNGELYICSQADVEVALPASTDDVAVSPQYCQALAESLRGIFAADVLSPKPVITARRACYIPTVDGGALGVRSSVPPAPHKV